ncbi:MAG: galactokinase [Clostridia bacterium]|nr:galactokinase [Clostridia bacterium]
MRINELKEYLASSEPDKQYELLYGRERVEQNKERYVRVADSFFKTYGDADETAVLSVPGRSEISGNHTDHNHGRVIAASVDCDMIAVAARGEGRSVRVKSDGYKEDCVDLDRLSPDCYPRYKSVALVAGMCAAFKNAGYEVGPLCAYTSSNVPKGSGLSSSAAFEVLVGTVINHLYNGGKVSPIEIAKFAKWAENNYFGKPCGLMDQTACAVGGFVEIDFEDPDKPVCEKIDFDLTGMGYDLCIVNTGGSHADLNDDYASIPREMKAVAAFFGKDVLRGVSEEDLLSNARAIREKCGDRAFLRALHFVNENDRVPEIASAMRHGDLDAFLQGIAASGDSSFKYLQNVFSPSSPSEQGETVALYAAAHALARFPRPGACRVHGGGFAGTMQAFVPRLYTEAFRMEIDRVMGKGACSVMHVRPVGAVRFC